MATAAPPAEHERERAPRRRGRGSRRVAVGAALLALAFLLALRQLGLLFPDHIVWPVMLAAAGVALIWRQWGGRGRPAPPPTTARSAATQAAPEPAVSDERAALRTLYRGGFGVALIVGAGLLFLYANGALKIARLLHGSLDHALIAPSAGITPQVRRVSAGSLSSRGALSQPAFPPAPLGFRIPP